MKKLILALSSIVMIQPLTMGVLSCLSASKYGSADDFVQSIDEEFERLDHYILIEIENNKFNDHQEVEKRIIDRYNNRKAFTFNKNALPNQEGYYIKIDFLKDSEKYFNFKVTLSPIVESTNNSYVIDDSASRNKTYQAKNNVEPEILVDKYIYNISNYEISDDGSVNWKIHILNYKSLTNVHVGFYERQEKDSHIESIDFDNTDRSYINVSLKNMNDEESFYWYLINVTISADSAKDATIIIYKR
ncbi:hypothetical protein SHELI_v1c04090 [Spiroplasma helicoides]|uniref:Lipoprotein n=1 Tax=Spiroplasma helicoides TaxID=216938 RepID=A0A1B3SKA7_9MOLU|nr:hypothetical protein [Spiroplasma helicoides]AOG60360.1 hypothetical protein SHELI_v1c04090 [Spiroplasma helicoides]